MIDREACCNSKIAKQGLLSQCNECGKTGKPVKRITLEHLLKEDRVSSIRNVQYFFCPSPSYNLVYFSEDGDTFYKTDLTVKVGLKETEEPIPVCYCFGYTRGMILGDFLKNGRSTIREEIEKNVKEGRCRCEITNPEGKCCLGNVAQVLTSIACNDDN